MNVAANIDEVSDVILALLPHLHTAWVKRESRYSIAAKINTDAVDEETTKILIDPCLAYGVWCIRAITSKCQILT